MNILNDISMINNGLLILFILSFAIIFILEHRSKDSPITFSDLLVDPNTNKISITKLGQLLGIIFSSWIIMFFAQKVSPDQIATMFPWIFGTWLTFLVTAQGIKTILDKDKK